MLSHYLGLISFMFQGMDSKHEGQIGYLTIDEKLILAGKTQRRSGLHVDGVYNGTTGSWGGGGGGSWGSAGNGMLTIASVAGCKAYNQTFEGRFGKDGECESLASQCQEDKATLFKPYHLYWVDGLCVHESVPMKEDTKRQFVRLSLPSNGAWFEGYTENPVGVKPTGPILPARTEYSNNFKRKAS